MTKAKARAKEACFCQLRRCGHSSWRLANRRRGELIMRFIRNDLTGDECEELDRLQKLADLYLNWSCFDFYKAQDTVINCLEQMLKRTGR